MKVSKRSWHYKLINRTLVSPPPYGMTVEQHIQSWSAVHYVVSVILWSTIATITFPIWGLFIAGSGLYRALVKKYDGVQLTED